MWQQINFSRTDVNIAEMNHILKAKALQNWPIFNENWVDVGWQRKSNLNGIGMVEHKLCHLLWNIFPSFIYLFAGAYCVISTSLLYWIGTQHQMNFDSEWILNWFIFPKCVIRAVDPTFKSYRPAKMQIPKTINNARFIIWNVYWPIANGHHTALNIYKICANATPLLWLARVRFIDC